MSLLRFVCALVFGSIALPAFAAVPGSIEVTCDVDRKAFRSAAAPQTQVTFQLWPSPAGGSPCGSYVVPMSGLVVFKAKTDKFDAQRGRKFAQIRAVLGSDASPVQLCSLGQGTWLDVTVGSTTLTCDFSATDPKVSVAPGRRRLVAVPFAGQGTDISARVDTSTPLSVPDATNFTATFDSERWDTDNIHDGINPSRLTVPVTGKYLIYAWVVWAGDPNGTRSAEIFLDGGGTEIASESVPAATTPSTGTHLNVSTHYALAAGEFVTLVLGQHSGAALNAAQVEFGMVKLP
jgi:hypothetical protein